MSELRADTAVDVKVGPVMDVADGITPVTNLTLSGADEAELLKHDASATTDISGRTFGAITGADGYYNLSLTAGDLDTEGELILGINDDSLILPVCQSFMVLDPEAWDAKYLNTKEVMKDQYWVRVYEIGDVWTVLFNRNSTPLKTGVSAVTLTVTKVSDGTALFTSQALTELGSTHIFKRTELTNLVTPGDLYVAEVAATISGVSSPTFPREFVLGQ